MLLGKKLSSRLFQFSWVGDGISDVIFHLYFLRNDWRSYFDAYISRAQKPGNDSIN